MHLSYTPTLLILSRQTDVTKEGRSYQFTAFVLNESKRHNETVTATNTMRIFVTIV